MERIIEAIKIVNANDKVVNCSSLKKDLKISTREANQILEELEKLGYLHHKNINIKS